MTYPQPELAHNHSLRVPPEYWLTLGKNIPSLADSVIMLPFYPAFPHLLFPSFVYSSLSKKAFSLPDHGNTYRSHGWSILPIATVPLAITFWTVSSYLCPDFFVYGNSRIIWLNYYLFWLNSPLHKLKKYIFWSNGMDRCKIHLTVIAGVLYLTLNFEHWNDVQSYLLWNWYAYNL